MHLFHTAGGRTRVNSVALMATLMHIPASRRPGFLARLQRRMALLGIQY